MAHASRNERRKRRIRRNVSLLGRQVRELASEKFKLWTHLVAILSQNGGEVTVTAGTLEQAFKSLPRTTYQVDPSKTDKDGYVFRLVVTEPQPELENVEGKLEAPKVEEPAATTETPVAQ